jgi:perosamine synthetase
VPTFQGLSIADLIRPAGRARAFPFDVPDALHFYRARNAIYYLFKALADHRRDEACLAPTKVLVPDYNSGNEVAAIDAAGAALEYYSVDERGTIDVANIERLCDVHRPDVLYVIHYLGWPQPIEALAELCHRRGIWLVEDCALALLSETNSQPLGTFGDWAVFCLYKTLPVPNGAILTQNTARLEALTRLPLREAGSVSVAGRTAELMVQRLRSRADRLGGTLQRFKRTVGRAVGAMELERIGVGDIGFDLADVDLRMSAITERLLTRLDYADIRRRRIANAKQLADALKGHARLLHGDIPEGVCPLFLPILVENKRAAAETLRAHGVEILEFWNQGIAKFDAHSSANGRSLRAHVLGLPIHQDLTPHHIAHIAEVVCHLQLGSA